MAGRRDQIVLSPAEIAAFLDESRTLIAATNGPRGVPHVMPLWYVMRGEEPWAWTFARSQKTVNLERDPRATLLVEDGEAYDKLRGVQIECDVELVRDPTVVREFAVELFTRYTQPAGELPPEVLTMIDAQLPRRVALRYKPNRYASWDHRKLAGSY